MASLGQLFLLLSCLFAPYWGDKAADVQVCIDSFVVHADKIIRTQDSRALGAKYLTDGEVGSRNECLQLCCITPTCDVFVYEHKRRGSCYLFHCGDPQDFKCKFTQHRNYSSGVLMPASELEAQIKLTKHEEELAQLSKKPETVVPVVSSVAETTAHPPSTTVKPSPPPKVNTTTRSECSRYQFECRTTHECVAIYNACDGIPQCSDGSDEAPELDCPTITGATSHPGQAAVHKPPMPLPNDVQSDVKKSYPHQEGPQYPAFSPLDKQDAMSAYTAQQQLINQVKGYGREGEGAPEPPNGWRGYVGQPRKPADEQSRIFNHKGGLMPQGERYNSNHHHHHQSSVNDYAQGSQGNSYGTEGGGKVGGNGYYGNPYPPFNWGPRQRDDPRWMYPAPPPPPDYYYEEGQVRGWAPQQAPEQKIPQLPAEHPEGPAPSPPSKKPVTQTNPPPVQEEKNTLSKVEEGKSNAKETASVKKVIEPEAEVKIQRKPPAPTHASMVVVEDDVVVVDSTDGENERPRGAMLSLGLGMCIAAIMITLVGCRLRVVQRRLRRGKAGYAHNADFLVNGMYL